MIMQKPLLADAIIGGMFGLQASRDLKASYPPFMQKPGIYMVNARSGIWLLANQLSPGQIWCPSYLCHTILEAVRGSMGAVRFYEVSYDLRIVSFDWLDQVERGDLVILIDYFGFSIDSACAVQARERGAWVLEDASQALLSGNVGRFSDFSLYSPRKFVGVPDGGILCSNYDAHFQAADLKAPPAEWWLNAFLASLLRREFDIHGGARPWFELFQKTEPNAPIGLFAMSELSKTLLQNNLDYLSIARRRVENYQTLADKLGSLALFPHLPAEVVPLGFPIRTKKRDEVRQALFAHEIYPPVHWLIKEVVPPKYIESHRLASEIMTLPCDQRYDSNDMSRIVQVIAETLGW
jgi:dTDP-4-amino-4,6-dideoxygalactose transaminase